MSEVTYDALRKRLAEAEEELSIWRSVFPDIAPERVLPDRSLHLARIAELEAALERIIENEDQFRMAWAAEIARAALKGGKKDE